jgi:hypothetical protein
MTNGTRPEIDIKDMQALAFAKGGKCLSAGYKTAKIKLLWECGEGHQWEASPDNIKRGRWCPKCSGRSVTIHDLRELAKIKGGECLSAEYKTTQKNYDWKCFQGHVFHATHAYVKRGGWCRVCKVDLKTDQLTLENFLKTHRVEIVKLKKTGEGFELSLRCDDGHEWPTTSGAIAAGRICPVCSKRKFININQLNEIAKIHGGECLSSTYTTARKKYLWRCQSGHTWRALYTSIKRGSWCPTCNGNRSIEISELQALASERGGSCLSEHYHTARTKYTWRCKKGHEWDAQYDAVRRGGWCPRCALFGHSKYSLKDAQDLATSRGGKFLSKELKLVLDKYPWRCANGHQWVATFSSINGGSWCPSCSRHLGERFTRIAFEVLSGEMFPTSRPDWLRYKNGNRLSLDGYCEKLALAFEHQGEQHYSNKNYFGNSNEERNKILEYDQYKKWLCKQNGVKLLEVPEVPRLTSLEELEQMVSKFLITNLVNIKSEIIDFNSAYIQDNRIERLKKTAGDRGGRLLDSTYLGMRHRYNWQCNEGHTWSQTADAIVTGKIWCPYCSGRRPTIEWLSAWAKSNDGHFISESYIKNAQKLNFECKKGHLFSLNAQSLKRGGWCPQCNKQPVQSNFENLS